MGLLTSGRCKMLSCNMRLMTKSSCCRQASSFSSVRPWVTQDRPVSDPLVWLSSSLVDTHAPKCCIGFAEDAQFHQLGPPLLRLLLLPAAGCWLLAAGCWLLAAGCCCWLLAANR